MEDSLHVLDKDATAKRGRERCQDGKGMRKTQVENALIMSELMLTNHQPI
jgi:hypothetical protein